MKKVIYTLLLIFWIFIIYYLSNQAGSVSGSNSGYIIYNIVAFIYKLLGLNNSNIDVVVEIIHNPIREVMHLLEYLILGIIMYATLGQYNITKNIILITIMLCFIYSVTDEIHQVFIPGRTFEYIDIILDSIGSIIGVLFFHNFSNKKLE